MKLSKKQYKKLEPFLFVQCENVAINNQCSLDAIVYVPEKGCK